jgi:TonB family protein
MRPLARKLSLYACIVAAAALPAAARPKKSNKAAIALIQKALAASDIQAKGSAPFRLQATTHVWIMQGEEHAGMLVDYWTPTRQWRKELSLPNYKAVSGFDGKREWVKQPLDYVPYPIHVLWQALNFNGRLRWLLRATSRSGHGKPQPVLGAWSPSGVWLEKPQRERKENQECVEADLGKSKDRTFCFAASSGLLVFERNEDTDETYEYSDYAPFAGKMFPRTLRLLGPQQQVLLEIHVGSIDPLGANDTATLFSPVTGAKQVTAATSCAKLLPLKVVKKVPPTYPPDALAARIQGKVVLYVEIGTDGVPRGINVAAASSLLLVPATTQAVQKWRYRPATCVEPGGSRAKAVDTYITVFFTLSE